MKEYGSSDPERQPEASPDATETPAAPELPMLIPHLYPTRPQHPYKFPLESKPRGGELPDGVIAWEEYMQGYVPGGRINSSDRTQAASTAHHLEAYVRRERATEAHKPDANSPEQTSDPERVVQYVTDPLTGEYHKVVSVDRIRELMADGKHIGGIGKVSRGDLERVLSRYPPKETAPAETSERSPEHLTEQELRAALKDERLGNLAVRAARVIRQHEVQYDLIGVPTPPEESVYESFVFASGSEENTSLINVANLEKYLSPEHFRPGQISRLGSSATEVWPALARYVKSLREPDGTDDPKKT
jgi:hypothetical protein